MKYFPRSVDARGFTAGQKNCGKSGLGLRVAGHGPSGPSQAVGLWATGLLLAIPCFERLKGRGKTVCWCPKHWILKSYS